MRRSLFIILTLVAVVIPAAQTSAVKIADITRLDGERANVIQGFGLVLGLNGTGDTGDYLPAIRPFAQLLRNMGNPSDPRDLVKTQAVALVYVTAVLPAQGFHKNGRIDVRVTVAGSATKLTGGTLVQSPLSFGPGVPPLAYASGLINIENVNTPTTGVIAGGAELLYDWHPKVVKDGHIRLVLEDVAAKGNWSTANAIAAMINEAESMSGAAAVAVDATTVDVTIPASERDKPDSFISRVQQLWVRLVPTEARVVINDSTKGIVISGDVEISPAVVVYNGLTISTVTPPPTPSPRTPVTTEKRAVALDTTNTGGAKLKDLVDALDLIRVPPEDRVAIIKQLYAAGKIHAKLDVTK